MQSPVKKGTRRGRKRSRKGQGFTSPADRYIAIVGEGIMNGKGIHSSDWIFYGSPQETVCLHELCAFTDEIKIVEGCQPYT